MFKSAIKKTHGKRRSKASLKQPN